MKKRFSNIFIFILLGICFVGQAQNTVHLTNIAAGDTLVNDTLSIISSSLFLVENQDTINNKFSFEIGSTAVIAKESIESATLYYQTYPLNFQDDYYNKDTSIIQDEVTLINPRAVYEVNASRNEPIFFEGLNKSGSLSRGITVGNNQDAVLNSNLNLQLSGKINPSTTIKASITDNQIPVYAEGVSQSLREFDRVFIEVKNDQFGTVQAGDFDIGPSGHYFLKFKKRISGAGVQSPIKLGKGTLNITGVGALARGEFNRNTFRGTEGNQGPYKLTGKNNELVILVISGSERVYIDGRLQKRGLDQHYTIDYTTGEVTFTALRPITKDSRIVVEFQYTVQNFTRSIAYGGLNYTDKNWQHSFFMYSEQDAKNQSIRPLSIEEKEILANAGDDPLKAVSPSWNETAYDANRILYALKDTLGFDSVFVFSTDETDTLYEVSFSFVGNNAGDYIALQTAANGIVYQFAPPIGGERQGTHIPFTILPRPERIQVATYLGGWRDETQNLNWEVAYSNNDPNRYSNLDADQHSGFAGKLGYDKNWKKKKWNYTAGANGEHTTENFKTVERIRNVEFSRDWNLQTLPTNSELWKGGAKFAAQKTSAILISTQSDYIQIGQTFQGFKNQGALNVNENGWFAQITGSYLSTKDTSYSTSFFRQRSKLQRNFKNLQYLGIESESETNTASDKTENNLYNYRFLDYYVFTGYGDTSKSYIEGGYFNRTDDTIRSEDWTRAAEAKGVRFKSAFQSLKYGNLIVKGQYRELDNITDSATLKSVTARVQYNNRFFKNFLAWNSFYEANMGREPRRNYKYLKVPKGTGSHIWVDYNNNGLEEIDEFEPTPFPDQGEYVRIFVISRDYLPISNVKFTQQLDFNFYNLPGIRGTKKWPGKFNLQTYYLLNRKELLTGETNNLNPFDKSVTDSLIIQQLETLRTTLFFNRSSPVFGADYSFQQNTAKNLLSFGLENNLVKEHTMNVRYIVKRKTTLRLTGKLIDKRNGVPDFESRNYQINTEWIKPQVSYQSGKYFRFSVDYTFENSANSGENAEVLNAQKAGGEVNLNHPKIATATARIDWVQNNFTGNAFSPIGYEMLKGLSPGTNYLWQFSLQKNITSFLQIVLNYNGRSTETGPTVHTGTVQVKAFF